MFTVMKREESAALEREEKTLFPFSSLQLNDDDETQGRKYECQKKILKD